MHLHTEKVFLMRNIEIQKDGEVYENMYSLLVYERGREGRKTLWNIVFMGGERRERERVRV